MADILRGDERFDREFEPWGDAFLYRRNGIGPARRLSADERKAMVGHGRSLARWTFVASLIVLLGLIGIAVNDGRPDRVWLILIVPLALFGLCIWRAYVALGDALEMALRARPVQEPVFETATVPLNDPPSDGAAIADGGATYQAQSPHPAPDRARADKWARFSWRSFGLLAVGAAVVAYKIVARQDMAGELAWLWYALLGVLVLAVLYTGAMKLLASRKR